jgi:3-phosphoshikimate 1-carboxyvinyltransferase
MGATVEATDDHAPLRVRGGALTAIDWRSPVASAQVKSAVLLAGLRARGTTRVDEPLPSRDHTERLLPEFGVAVERKGGAVAVDGGQRLRATTVELPGDASSAAFFVVAGLLVPGSRIRLADVGVNPTRIGFLAVLERMGATVERLAPRERGGEPRADLVVGAAALRGTAIAPDEVPGLIDEVPALCVAAALATGETVLAGAAELRVKESDRLAALEQLALLGADVRASADGLVIRGSGGRPLAGGQIRSGGDHRIAMAFAVAGLVAENGVVIDDPACAAVSFPGFFEALAGLGARVEAA